MLNMHLSQHQNRIKTKIPRLLSDFLKKARGNKIFSFLTKVVRESVPSLFDKSDKKVLSGSNLE